MTNTLIDTARTWINVRWRHRGRSRHGVDCAGLVVLTYRDCGVELPDYMLYGKTPYDDGLLTYTRAALGHELPEDSSYKNGDVVLMRFYIVPHHMAFIALVEYAGQPAINIIHSDGHTGRVLEQRLTPDMHARITHVFRRAL